MITVSCDPYQQYDLTVIDRGGEHTVFRAAGHEGIVLKVHRRVTELMAGGTLEEGALSADWREFTEVYFDTEQYRLRRLTAHFGYAHVPRHKKGLLCLAAEWWSQIFGREETSPTGNCFQALVTVQRQVTALTNPKRLSLAGGYAELLDGVDMAVYQRVTDQLVWGETGTRPVRIGEFLTLHPAVAKLLYKTQGDEQLRGLVCEIVQNIILYSQETDEILDLAASNNLIVWPQRDGWQYCLVDALYPLKPDMLAQAQAILSGFPATLTEREYSILLNTVNFVRLINGLAHFMDVDERIRLYCEHSAIDLWAILCQGVTEDE